MVCTPTINNIAITKTLIDGGAGLNVISVDTFDKMQIPYDRLMSAMPFSRVTSGHTILIKQVRLNVMFGTKDNYRTELLDFDVAHLGLPYNVILGDPALSKFMAITHHAYNIVKMPGSNSIITVHCDERDALNSLEQAYKVVVAAYPADKDAENYIEGSARKKQMAAQESTGTRKTAQVLDSLAEEITELKVSSSDKAGPSTTPGYAASPRSSPNTSGSGGSGPRGKAHLAE